ncbi:N-acetylglucosaminyl phosphatidylinositol deacetylase-related like protein [Aduncisulcus paluster]|uniref:N-acetylglucosaminylphosphatidylinositol deacetylase n=1 Tax=Aduncisulcus paluster TaxID=2918883 RepID=A0ABQ5JV94_9EUKA|nr:N-acetylglucosaminyl phosphatidylinositol deacetylase-related like protein [Aduncisulcus paluster]
MILDRILQWVQCDLSSRVVLQSSFPITGKRILVISPHPDDDVISMGGTLALLAQNNDVHVAYGVSGHVAVSEIDTDMHLHFVELLPALSSVLKICKPSETGNCLSSEESDAIRVVSKLCQKWRTTECPSIRSSVKGIILSGHVAVSEIDTDMHLHFVELLPALSSVLKICKPSETGNCLSSEESDAIRVVSKLCQKWRTTECPSIRSSVKGIIRRVEAMYGAHVCGVPKRNTHFLDLPFYSASLSSRKELSDRDVSQVLLLLKYINPDHIFVAGDLSDPHGTHKKVYDCVNMAIQKMFPLSDLGDIDGTDDEKKRYHFLHANVCEKYTEIPPMRVSMAKTEAVGNRPCMWLYRGAWSEWDMHEADMFVVMSPTDIEQKKEAIFRHESQKDHALFPGDDAREFWQRAADRNRDAAETLATLGLPRFSSIEAFVSCFEMP